VTLALTDADEKIRRDLLLDDNADMTAFSAYTPAQIADEETFQLFDYGYDRDWIAQDVGIKTYVEWLLDVLPIAVSTAPIFANKAGAGTYPVLLARASSDPLFVDGVFTTAAPPVTVADGAHTISITKAASVYTMTLDAGASLTISSGGQIISQTGQPTRYRYTLTTPGSTAVEVLVDRTELVSVFGTLADASYDNTVTFSTRGPRLGTGTATGPGGEYVTTLGSKYTAPYRTKKTLADFVPTLYDSWEALVQDHGEVDGTTKNDHLSVGSYPYFQQGGQSVYAVPLKDAAIIGTSGFDLDEPTGAGYTAAVQAALVQLEDVADVSEIIPLSPTESIDAGNYRPGIISAVLSHVNRMSSITQMKPRMAILGARAGTVNEDVFTAAATTMKSNRMLYVAPATATLSISGINKVVDGSLIAASIAGILSSGVNAGEPITGKVLTAFVDIPDPFTRTQKERIGGTYGVTVIEKVGGQSKIMHFLTSNPDTSLTAEGKITVIEIDIRRSLKAGLDATLINTRLVNGQSVAAARSMVGLMLNQKISAQIINAFQIINIAVDPNEPRQLNVELKVQPVFDLNWIYINATFVVS
jgi:hypothetical protein